MMRRTLRLGVDDIIPQQRAVLAHQGIPADAEISTRIGRLRDRAEQIFAACARPVGLIGEIATTEFAAVFEGEGENAHDAVVGTLLANADRLALYAATIGATCSRRIDELFADKEFALGSMLDSVASIAAERTADELAAWYRRCLIDEGTLPTDTVVLGYSPGYCGWHITGQRKLFARLKPERIGISLNESCMMIPLKSVSGLLLAASPQVHAFKPRFSYCPECRQRSCIGRIEPLRDALRGA